MHKALGFVGTAIVLGLAGAGLYIILPVLPALLYWEWGCHL